MLLFLIPLVMGYAFFIGSLFTAAFSRRWGEKMGSLISAILRDIIGMALGMLGFVMAVRAHAPLLFTPTSLSKLIGWLLIGLGAVIVMTAMLTIRRSALIPSIRDRLVDSGLYAHVRHPIHDGLFMVLLGIFLIFPSLSVAIACGLGVVWLLLQTRVEERDLLQRLPEYRHYIDAVPSFIPRFHR
jgi:protein-S-isoprenylcysteine O-methyltransferase Ste14